jgi:hypothetical protein
LLAQQGALNQRIIQFPLNPEDILVWAEAHARRCGEWPHQHSGPIPEVRGLNWKGVDHALATGLRGLPGGTSLRRLVRRHRNLMLRSPAGLRGRVAEYLRECSHDNSSLPRKSLSH